MKKVEKKHFFFRNEESCMNPTSKLGCSKEKRALDVVMDPPSWHKSLNHVPMRARRDDHPPYPKMFTMG